MTRTVSAIARADFLERARRPGILVTVAVTLYAVYGFVPPNHAHYATMKLGDHRGIYNSAWVGTLVALLATTFLSLFGFYLVKNALEPDRRSGVGPVLAATPLSKWTYVLGKALSNLTLLAAVLALLMVGAALMQQVRGEDSRLDLIQLVAPFLIIALPAMATVAAVAVLFEVVPGLRGGFGNVVYFFLWMAGLSSGLLQTTRYDFLGLGVIRPSIYAACQRVYADADLVRTPMSLGFNIKRSGVWDLTTFRWEGLEWSAAIVLARFAWVGVALGACGLATWWFDRFDAAPKSSPRRRRSRTPRAESSSPLAPAATGDVHLTPLASALRFDLLPLVRAELKLLLRGLPWWGVTAAGGLVLASFLAPQTAVEHAILPALWILPLFLWSALGNRESRHGTESLVFSAPRPVLRPLLAQWLAGVLVALALGVGVLVRAAVAGRVDTLAGIFAGAAFVPALAVALGAWSRSPKLFEVVYLLLWYMGPINRVPFLDYTGGSASVLGAAGWSAVALACLAAGAAARRRR